MPTFVKFGNFEKLELGMPTRVGHNQVEGGLLEAAKAQAGDCLVYGDVQGQYDVMTDGNKQKPVAGILSGDMAKLNMVFGEPSTGYVKGDAINVMTEGYIAVELDGGQKGTVKQGMPVYVVPASGKFTTVVGDNVKVGNAIFTGETATVDGKDLASIHLK